MQHVNMSSFDNGYIERLTRQLKTAERMEKQRIIQLNSFSGKCGLRIRQLRLERKMLQRDFEDIGLSANIFCPLEKGEGLGIHRLEAIMNYLKITPKEFFNHEIFD